MALETAVKEALIVAGTQLKKDLWRDEDLKLIAAKAKDLVGLYAKHEGTSDKKKKRQYALAAMSVVDHVKLLALLRMQVAQNHVLEALGKFFLEKALPALAKVLMGML
jgi:hypothetical protein